MNDSPEAPSPANRNAPQDAPSAVSPATGWKRVGASRTGSRERRDAVGGRGPSLHARTSLLVHGVLLAAVTAAVFLVAGPPQGSLGIFLICAGVVMIGFPPRVPVDWRLWLAAAGMVGAGGLAFLPMRFLPEPAWRAALRAVPAIPLPTSITPVPLETAFWLALLAISALVGLFALAHPVRSGAVLIFATLAVGICTIYAALAILAKNTGWHYPFDGGATFGFFPNRNHTAAFLVTGSILAMGVLRVALRERRWFCGMAAGMGLAVGVVALFFFSASRGGVVFLLAGTAFWLAGLGRTDRNVPLLVSVAALLAAGGLLFVLSGSEVRNRLLPGTQPTLLLPQNQAARNGGITPARRTEPPPDFRVFILRDTLQLMRDFPLTGVGLGAFEKVFPQYQRSSLSDATVLHPESDWLLFGSEAGPLAGICAALLLWLLLKRSRHRSNHPFWAVYWSLAAAVTVTCLHGIVDVPVHRVVLGWWVVVLAGLGFHGGWTQASQRSRVQHGLFVLGGCAALALGVQLIRAQWFGGEPLPPFALEGTQANVLRIHQAGDTTGALRTLRTYLHASSFYGPYYAQLGTLLAQAPHADAAVDEAFHAQRLVAPHDPVVPFEQGLAWITNDTGRTATLWREALARRRRIDHAQGRDERGEISFYQDMLRRTADFPELQEALLEAEWPKPEFVLSWIGEAAPEMVRAQAARIAHAEDFRQRLDLPQRKRFLLGLYQRGAQADADSLKGEEEWRNAAWPLQVREMADLKQYESLVALVCEREHLSLKLPEDGGSNLPPANSSDQEDADPSATFEMYWRAGNTVAARRVLEEATRRAAGVPEVWRLKAAVAVNDKDWPAAWSYLEQYLQQTHRSE